MDNPNQSNPVGVREHKFDGIQEEENPLPRWWVNKFYITILFAAVYVLFYHVMDGKSLDQEYRADRTAYENQFLRGHGTSDFPNEANLIALMKQDKDHSLGKGIFATRCLSCHGAEGQGGIGPNLTDNFWINGKGTPKEIAKIVHDGVMAKGMPAWGGILKDDEVYEVVGFVASLKGTNPANPKAPQGEKVEDAPAAK